MQLVVVTQIVSMVNTESIVMQIYKPYKERNAYNNNNKCRLQCRY